jgi:hypothetical protein
LERQFSAEGFMNKRKKQLDDTKIFSRKYTPDIEFREHKAFDKRLIIVL